MLRGDMNLFRATLYHLERWNLRQGNLNIMHDAAHAMLGMAEHKGPAMFVFGFPYQGHSVAEPYADALEDMTFQALQAGYPDFIDEDSFVAQVADGKENYQNLYTHPDNLRDRDMYACITEDQARTLYRRILPAMEYLREQAIKQGFSLRPVSGQEGVEAEKARAGEFFRKIKVQDFYSAIDGDHGHVPSSDLSCDPGGPDCSPL